MWLDEGKSELWANWHFHCGCFVSVVVLWPNVWFRNVRRGLPFLHLHFSLQAGSRQGDLVSRGKSIARTLLFIKSVYGNYQRQVMICVKNARWIELLLMPHYDIGKGVTVVHYETFVDWLNTSHNTIIFYINIILILITRHNKQ